MPNTKSLPRLERKAAKRKIRRGDKELYRGLTQKQRREFRESKNGIKLFVAEKGAEIIFLPHASSLVEETASTKKARWLRYVPARAYDNTVYVAICNQVGDNGAGRRFAGVTFICNPLGEVIAEAHSSTEEEMVIADLKAAELTQARSVAEHFFRHFRRPELYQHPNSTGV